MAVTMAFTTQQTANLSNITPRMLRYWEETGVFHPEYIEQRNRGPFRRIYSFRDLVTLRTLSLLRKQHRLPLDELRKAGAYLQEFSERPWIDLSLRIQGRILVFRNPATGQWTAADASGQTVMTIDLQKISEESERVARLLTRRDPRHFGKITRNRYVMNNAWSLSGTRIPIDAVIELHGAGFSDNEILKQYPTLHQADIDVALSFDLLSDAA